MAALRERASSGIMDGMQAIGKLANCQLPSDERERASVLRAAAERLKAGPLDGHLHDAVWRAAGQVLRAQARNPTSEATIAALQCISNIVAHEAHRITPELVDLIAQNAVRPACDAIFPPSSAVVASCETSLRTLAGFASIASNHAGGLVQIEPLLLQSLLQAARIPMCFAAATKPPPQEHEGRPGVEETILDPRLPFLIDLVKALHETLACDVGMEDDFVEAADQKITGRAQALADFCEALADACNAEASRPSPHFLLKNHLWRLLVRIATTPILLRATMMKPVCTGVGRQCDRDGHDPRKAAALVSVLPARLFHYATCRLIAQVDAALDATEAARVGFYSNAKDGSSELVRLALFGLVQLRNLCMGYRNWLGMEADLQTQEASVPVVALTRIARRLQLHLAANPEENNAPAKLLDKVDECMNALLGIETLTAAATEPVAVAAAVVQDGAHRAKASNDFGLSDEATVRLLQGWATMALHSVRRTDCGILDPAPIASADKAVSGLATSSPWQTTRVEATDWLWLQLLILRASCRSASESMSRAAASISLPATLELLPHAYDALLGPCAAPWHATSATSLTPSCNDVGRQGRQGVSVLTLVSTLICGYGCTAPPAARELVLSSLLNGALSTHPLPRLIAREAMATAMAKMSVNDVCLTLGTMLELTVSLIKIGAAAARERQHLTEVIAGIILHSQRASIQPVLHEMQSCLEPAAIEAAICDDHNFSSLSTAQTAQSSDVPEDSNDAREDNQRIPGEAEARLLQCLFLLEELHSAAGQALIPGASTERRNLVKSGPTISPSPSGRLRRLTSDSFVQGVVDAGGAGWAVCVTKAAVVAPPHIAPHMMLGAASLMALLHGSASVAEVTESSSKSTSPVVYRKRDRHHRNANHLFDAICTLTVHQVQVLETGGELAGTAAEVAAILSPALESGLIQAIAQAVGTSSSSHTHGDMFISDSSSGRRGVGNGVGRFCLLVVALLRRTLSAKSYDYLAQFIFRLISATASSGGHTTEVSQMSTSSAADFSRDVKASPSNWLGVYESARAAAEFTTTANVESLGRLIGALRSECPAMNMILPTSSTAMADGESEPSLALPLMNYLEQADAEPDPNSKEQVAHEMAIAAKTTRRLMDSLPAPPNRPATSAIRVRANVVQAADCGIQLGAPDDTAGETTNDTTGDVSEGDSRPPLQHLKSRAGFQRSARGEHQEPPIKRARLAAMVERELDSLDASLVQLRDAVVTCPAERSELKARLRSHVAEVHCVLHLFDE